MASFDLENYLKIKFQRCHLAQWFWTFSGLGAKFRLQNQSGPEGSDLNKVKIREYEAKVPLYKGTPCATL